MRNEWELNCLIAGLPDSIIDRIYTDMLSLPSEQIDDIAPVSHISHIDFIA